MVTAAPTAALKWPPFSSSCPSQIKAGPKVLGRFCGEKAPEPINTQTHNVQIRFRSDNSGENRGWKLSYSATGNLVIMVSPHERWLRDEKAQVWDSSGTVAGLPVLPRSILRHILSSDSVSHLSNGVKGSNDGVFELAELQNHMGRLQNKTWFLNHNPSRCDSLSLEKTLPASAFS